MARRATGAVIEHVGRDGRVYRALRFSAYGKRRYVTLGPVSPQDAERDLRHVLADVERGAWQPAAPVEAPPEPTAEPTFHQYAEQWWTLHERQVAEVTRVDYRWRLEAHLLPFFGEMRLSTIAIDDVDRYKAAKLREGRLGPSSINKTIILLAAILDSALERELVTRNVAAGKRRRVPERRPARTYLDTAEQIGALLDAAGAMDREAKRLRRHAHVERRALLATLVLAGLRIGELVDLRWRDVDLAAGRLTVGRAKTDAGVRHVTIRPALRDELLAVKARARHAKTGDRVFASRTGGRMAESNIRRRTLTPAVTLADAALTEQGSPPLPTGLTPHSLRRTFASLLYALDEPPPAVMAEMGHTQAGLALRIYASAMGRDDQERDRLRHLVDGAQLAADWQTSRPTAPPAKRGVPAFNE